MGAWELKFLAAVIIVLIPLIWRPVFPPELLEPSNKPRTGLFQSYSHGDVLHPQPTLKPYRRG